ncbi:MAG: hypothetical protein ACRDYU_10500 [Actinomycetes bacterium]
MTHEVTGGDEAPGGPENDERLPRATSIAVTDTPGPPDKDVDADGQG